MSYTSTWERLSEALTRVTKATGLSQTEAQADICRAIADGAIKVRGALGKRHTSGTTSRDTVLGGNYFQIPTSLKPEDLDWAASRPLEPWVVRRELFKVPGLWYLDWIELLRTDVTNALCSAEATSSSAPHASHQTGAKARSRPVRERIERALRELYPNGVPEQVDEPNKILFRHVNEWLKINCLPEAKNDTILRATGRRK
jgi:hypothetical protein